MNRPATASQSLGNPERKTLLAFLIWRGWNFFWKRKGCFSFGVLPSKYSGRWRNNADEVLQKLFFGERILQNFGSFVFEFGSRKWKRRGLGRNFPFAPLFVLGEFGADMYALYCTLAKECKFSYYISMATGKKLGENLRKWRLKKDMSQGDLATVLSVDRAYISNIENGRMNPTLSTLEKIANALGISSSELLK